MNQQNFPILLITLIAVSACTSQQATITTTTSTVVSKGIGSPSEAFYGYRRSIEDRDLGNFQRYVASEKIRQVEKTFRQSLNEENFNYLVD